MGYLYITSYLSGISLLSPKDSCSQGPGCVRYWWLWLRQVPVTSPFFKLCDGLKKALRCTELVITAHPNLFPKKKMVIERQGFNFQLVRDLDLIGS